VLEGHPSKNCDQQCAKNKTVNATRALQALDPAL